MLNLSIGFQQCWAFASAQALMGRRYCKFLEPPGHSSYQVTTSSPSLFQQVTNERSKSVNLCMPCLVYREVVLPAREANRWVSTKTVRGRKWAKESICPSASQPPQWNQHWFSLIFDGYDLFYVNWSFFVYCLVHLYPALLTLWTSMSCGSQLVFHPDTASARCSCPGETDASLTSLSFWLNQQHRISST